MASIGISRVMDDFKGILSGEDIRRLDSLSPTSRSEWLRRHAATLPRGDALACVQKYLLTSNEGAINLEKKFFEFLGSNYSDFECLPMSEKIDHLRTVSEALPKGDDLSIVLGYRDHLIDISAASSLEPKDLFRPNEYDVVVTDIKEADFLLIGSELGVQRLTKAPGDGSFETPVRGVIFGACHRSFVPLTVRKKNIVVYVLFLYDTGSPLTYLRRDTLHAIGHTESTPAETLVTIQGRSMTAYLSSAHFENVDIIGQDFMMFLGVTATVDYRSASVVLEIR
jgi:hypothetical protein